MRKGVYCSCDKLITVCPLLQYSIYFSRHFFFIICTRLKPRANNEEKMTRKIYLILHSRSCGNEYIPTNSFQGWYCLVLLSQCFHWQCVCLSIYPIRCLVCSSFHTKSIQQRTEAANLKTCLPHPRLKYKLCFCFKQVDIHIKFDDFLYINLYELIKIPQKMITFSIDTK